MANLKDSLGDRMKTYEAVPKNYLMRKTPVIIRLDGKAFHTFTKDLDKPFDYNFMQVMQKTMQYLCENIQGCVFGYTQSDEITLVLTDYKDIKTDCWFGYNVQKMTSISASMATLAFNKFWDEATYNLTRITMELDKSFNPEDWQAEADAWRTIGVLNKKKMQAMFDSRVFNIPKDEVCNCLIWRQQDATRNSIQAVGQYYFSAKELNKKSCDMIQDMLFTQKQVNWNDYSIACKRGSCCYKIAQVENEIQRNKWIVDTEIPIFTQDRNFVEQWL